MNEQKSLTSYQTYSCGINASIHSEIYTLFKHLENLSPMDKYGPMSGRCGPQTDQMEKFLSHTFNFRVILGEYIVPGVKSFKIDKPPHTMNLKTMIHFPSDTDDSFKMTAEEIVEWQNSYKVYADKNVQGIDKKFLHHALQGKSEDGEEAFRMKFVIRISTCPVMMDFDAQIISRQLNEDWPSKIKLVSVSGIDFAGRKHDIGDILYYISNWRKIFHIDPQTGLPYAPVRDFHVKNQRPTVKLHKRRLQNSLIRMVKLRLQACDQEGVQVVVETGIGLGVFSGTHIGIDGKIRAFSAKAIRMVLQEDGPTYKHIRAIVFALPILNKNKSNRRIRTTFDDFVTEFTRARYNGPIPVLIADQDMLRLTIAIARQGFIVSQLNPADSHGVFGEYWQNRGPAVEEKLALTTLGLLVQHHLINPQVLNPDNYHLFELNETDMLDYRTTITHDDERYMNKYCTIL